MIQVKIDGKIFDSAGILGWEQEKTQKMCRYLRKRLDVPESVRTAEEFALWKAGLAETEMRAALGRANAACALATAAATGISFGKRKISVAEIEVDFCDSQTLYQVFMDTMLINTKENILANLRANPEHFLLKGIDEQTQEVIEISGGIPFPERFFIRYGDETGLISRKEDAYPLQAAGAAFLKNGKKIGGVRHQMKDTENGCHVKLMVEFPGVMPDGNIRAHQYHLACEFYNWFSEFERRIKRDGICAKWSRIS